MFRFKFVALALAAVGCSGGTGPEVVVYTAHDDVYSRPILDGLEAATGITVRAAYDTEAAKTTGLVTRLVAEQERPRADVFWNNEIAQTMKLEAAGVLAPYDSPAAEPIPALYKDEAGYWTGFAARARVIIYNTELMETPPAGLSDFLDPQYRGQASIALPLFGTTATHAAALYAAWGDEKAQAWFEGLLENEVAVLAGNATVRDEVGRGTYLFGLTDTDDANSGKLDGLPVDWVYPDQGDDGLGTLLIPNTVALVAGGPNPEAGKQLIDYLLSAEVEGALAASRSLQIPLNPAVERPEAVPALDSIKAMQVDFKRVAEIFDAVADEMRALFL